VARASFDRAGYVLGRRQSSLRARPRDVAQRRSKVFGPSQESRRRLPLQDCRFDDGRSDDDFESLSAMTNEVVASSSKVGKREDKLEHPRASGAVAESSSARAANERDHVFRRWRPQSTKPKRLMSDAEVDPRRSRLVAPRRFDRNTSASLGR